MRKLFSPFLFLAVLLAGCGPSESEMLADAEMIAKTIIAETMAARPSETPYPSDTPTTMPSLTSTSLPTDAPSATPIDTATAVIKIAAPTMSPILSNGRTVRLRFDNQKDEIILVIFPSHNFAEYSFSDSWNLITPVGDYTYVIWIGNDGPYLGNFRITNSDKHTFVFTDGKVKFHYP